MSSLTITGLAILILLFAITSAVGVVTGSQSLVNVPVMYQFGIDPRAAVATNMFGLTFMSIGAAIPFIGKGVYDRRKMPWFAVLTMVGSALGAFLVGLISSQAMPLIISISMICVAAFSFFNHRAGIEKPGNPTPTIEILVYLLTFALGIYGGLFSGGYTTILTAIYVSLGGMTFTEAVANTKVINIFSSGIATLVFAWQGLIDYKLGLVLAVTMFVAAYFGAMFATKISDVWLKRIFLLTVFLLACKMLFFDIFR
jgi:hypothetical protein